MITRKPTTSLLSTIFASTSPKQHICIPCRRFLHERKQNLPVPSPTPFVPDVPTFLTLIGRELSKHASKFKSWNDLFTLSSTQLREQGLEPARTRRYLLRWRHKFRNGIYGIGGDFKYVSDGVGELRVVEIPSIKEPSGESDEFVSINQKPGVTRLILNVPNGSTTYKLEPGQTTKDLKKPKGFALRDGRIIVGSYAQPVKGTDGSSAIVKVTEGMWEDRRGHKVHGGERRRAETLHKLRIAERRNNS